MKNKESNLAKALKIYLYDQYDCPDVHEHDEESLVEDIIYALIEKNDNTCPFKNYDAMNYCKLNACCEYDLNIDCFRECEDVWKEFIAIDESEDE